MTGTGAQKRVLLTGGRGMVGRAVQKIAAEVHPALEIVAPGKADLDLREQAAVRDYFAANAFDAVIHCGARVGGISASVENPVSFLVQNLQINTNTVQYAYEAGVPDLIFVASSCMYPRDYRIPLKEEYVLDAPLEPTNEGYALSKICGAKHCEYISTESGLNYRTLIPCNLFGPHDDFTPGFSHLVAAAIQKIDTAMREGASSVEIWGDGSARREFLYVEDFARYTLDCLGSLADLPSLLNVGYGEEHSVLEYYRMIAQAMGYEGGFDFDTDRPVGMKSKLMDSSRARALGWSPQVDIRDGIERAVRFYRDRAGSDDGDLYRRSQKMYSE